jgi:hypothetical protein
MPRVENKHTVKSIPTGCSLLSTSPGLFSTLGIDCVTGDVDKRLQPVGIDFTVCLFSTLGIDCDTGDVDRMLQPVCIDFTVCYQYLQALRPHPHLQ